MKRKLLYSIIFISIFLMSSASMVTPVQGYEPPDIPSEAKGMTLDDTEVVVYDEDAMEDSLGKGFDIKDIKAGDADIVGARSQMKILDWETDEELVDYEEDFAWGTSVEPSHDLIVGLLLTLVDNGTMGAYPMGTAYGPYGALAFIANFSIWNATYNAYLPASANNAAGLALGNVTWAIINLASALRSWSEMIATYGESYDGTILEREVWDLLDPAEEFDPNDPDATGGDAEVPYLLDPRDWYSAYDNMNGYRNEVFNALSKIQQYWGAASGWWVTLAKECAGLVDFTAYEAINASIYEQVMNINPAAMVEFAYPGGGGATIPMKLSDFIYITINRSSDVGKSLGYPPGTFGVYDQDYVQGLWGFLDVIVETTRNTLDALLPDRFGYLLNTLEAGQPCCGPADDFIKRAVKEFNIRDGHIYKIPFIQYGSDLNNDGSIGEVPVGTVSPNTKADLGGETIYVYAEVEVEVDDAGTVTVSIEYLDNQQDPKDMMKNVAVPGSEDDPDELDDWEWVFPKAAEADTVMKDGDTVFYQTHPMEGPIPGYEIPVIIGVSLVSVIALIYVVMRKRKR